MFLHGTGTFTGFEMARDWAKRHTVIIPYQAGFGDSGDAVWIDTIEDHVLQTTDLLDKLGLATFDLAGFSLGGWLAAEFAIRQPHRVRKLVLVAPAGLVVASAPAPGLFEIAPQDLPAYLAHDPSNALRYFPKAPDPAFDARLGREVTGFAELIRSDPQGNQSSRTGCTGSRCRRWSCGAPRIACAQRRRPEPGRPGCPTRA